MKLFRKILLITSFILSYQIFAQNLITISGAYVNINGGTIATPIYVVVNEPSTMAITRTSGHAISEGQYNFIRWKSSSNTGSYTFPFGVGGTPTNYIPFTFNKITGSGDIDMSTWATNSQNMPHPNTSNVSAVTSMTCTSDSVQRAVDRFWDIRASATTANLNFSYLGTENTTSAPTAPLKAIHWNGSSWDPPVNPGNSGVVAGVGTVGPTSPQSSFSPWTLVNYQPPVISVINTKSISCYGVSDGSATVSVTNGAPSYTYNWSPSGQSTATLTNVPYGIHSVTVTDCNFKTDTISVSLTQPSNVTLSVAYSSVTCFGSNNGFATTTVSGGMGAYTYTWLPISANTNSVSNLAPNTYTIYTADLNNCIKQNTFTIQQPSAIAIAITSTNVSCYSFSNAIASSTVTGGTGSYSYVWSPQGGSSNVATNLPTGNYTITAVDANTCSSSQTVAITQPALFSLVASPNTTICYGTSTLLSANVSGGTAPYTYSWNPSIISGSGPSAVNPTVTSLYQVYAVDVNNCTTPTQTITVSVLPQLTSAGMQIAVCDRSTATLYSTLTSAGNGGPYNYLWSNGATTPSITLLANSMLGANQQYTLTISDACTVPNAIAISTLIVNPKPTGSFSANIQKGCVPLNVNFTGVSSSSGNTFYWNFGNGSVATGNNPNIAYSTSGSFSVSLEITSPLGCKLDTSVVNYINVYPYPIADFTASSYSVSAFSPEISFYNQSIGASTYQWDFGDYSSSANTSLLTNPTHLYSILTGTFNVLLMAENMFGCRSYTLKNIYVEPEFYVYIPNAFTPDGNNLNDSFNVKGMGINDKSGFLMTIYDRWGEQIFSTTNFYEGWNGIYKGKKVKEDVYVYKVTLLDVFGQIHEYAGSVTALCDDSR
ncbi:MAG: gliding motility-associated C-terminal domain-containing protein [Bacteroidetes bacterium]|nr:gliding motility-associated C-terminal domain-containing protein [Bacteroidota bacterium]